MKWERRRFLTASAALGGFVRTGLRALAPTLSDARTAVASEPLAAEDNTSGWGNPVDPDYRHAPAAAVETWSDWKFGMRIHMGVYSHLGLDASVPLVGSDREFQTIWFTLYQVFNPTGFNAEEWAGLAERAGMKYFVFTTRHDDGFSMFDTKTKVKSIRRIPGTHENRPEVGIGRTEPCEIAYSIMDTPFKTDVTRALVEAFRKKGMGIGLYYNWEDFHDPNYRWDKRNMFYDPSYSRQSQPEQWKAFVDRVTESVREIATNYGKIDIISFDQTLPREAWADLVRIVKMVRSAQPNVIMRNRGIGPYGDYSTPEHWIPGTPTDPRLEGKPWEAIEQLGSRWAYQPNDNYKPKEWLVATLVDVVAKGGNFMPGVSPMANGQFPPETIERLEYIGNWLRVNGEAIYNTRPWDRYVEDDDLRFTRSKDGRYVYAISLKWPGESLTVRSVRAKEGSAISMLGARHKLKWQQDDHALTIQIPPAIATDKPCQQAFAFKIEVTANS